MVSSELAYVVVPKKENNQLSSREIRFLKKEVKFKHQGHAV